MYVVTIHCSAMSLTKLSNRFYSPKRKNFLTHQNIPKGSTSDYRVNM